MFFGTTKSNKVLGGTTKSKLYRWLVVVWTAGEQNKGKGKTKEYRMCSLSLYETGRDGCYMYMQNKEGNW